MCKIANSFWINTWNDYCELRELFNDGARLASGLIFSHEINDGGETYYCFRPTDRRVDGAIYVTDYRLCDVFDLLNASVEYNYDETSIIFNGLGMIINHGKTIKFKRDDEFVYKLQKTQYKGKSAYGVLCHLVNNFWHNSMVYDLQHAGYIL